MNEINSFSKVDVTFASKVDVTSAPSVCKPVFTDEMSAALQKFIAAFVEAERKEDRRALKDAAKESEALSRFLKADNEGTKDAKLTKEEAESAGLMFCDLDEDGLMSFREVDGFGEADRAGSKVDEVINAEEAKQQGLLFNDENGDRLMTRQEYENRFKFDTVMISNNPKE